MLSETFIMAIDQGTTSSQAIILIKKARQSWRSSQKFLRFSGLVGWSTIPMKFGTVQSVIAEFLSKVAPKPNQIEAIGIANRRRETTVVWDRTQASIYNPLPSVWQSRQTYWLRT